MSHRHNWILPDGSNWITPAGDNYVTPEPILHLAVPAGRIAYVPWSEVTVFALEASRTVQVAGENRVVYATSEDTEAKAEE